MSLLRLTIFYSQSKPTIARPPMAACIHQEFSSHRVEIWGRLHLGVMVFQGEMNVIRMEMISRTVKTAFCWLQSPWCHFDLF